MSVKLPLVFSAIWVWSSADFIQSRDDFGGQLQAGRFQVIAQMRDRRSARNQQNVGRTLQQPRQRDLQRRRV